MTILRNLYNFNIPEEDLVQIYCLYIRSVLEYNSSVWFSSITQEENYDIERVQRCACKIILEKNVQRVKGFLMCNLTQYLNQTQYVARRWQERYI